MYFSSNALSENTQQPQVKALRYPRMKKSAIQAFSIIGILLGLASIGLQISSITIEVTIIGIYGYDVIGAGIWGGVFYIIAGSLGWAAASKRAKSLLVTSLVFSTLSIAASIVAATFSGIDASNIQYYSYYYCRYVGSYYYCGVYAGLEWAVMSVSIAAFISNIVLLVLTSMAVCCGGPKKNTTVSVQQPAIANYQQHQLQPVIYFQHGQENQKQPVGYYVVAPVSTPATVLQQQQHQPLNVQQLMIPAPVHQPILALSTNNQTPMPEMKNID